jgi:hypothetical protein
VEIVLDSLHKECRFAACAREIPKVHKRSSVLVLAIVSRNGRKSLSASSRQVVGNLSSLGFVTVIRIKLEIQEPLEIINSYSSIPEVIDFHIRVNLENMGLSLSRSFVENLDIVHLVELEDFKEYSGSRSRSCDRCFTKSSENRSKSLSVAR